MVFKSYVVITLISNLVNFEGNGGHEIAYVGFIEVHINIPGNKAYDSDA